MPNNQLRRPDGNRPVILPLSGRSSRFTIAGTPFSGSAFAASAASTVMPGGLSIWRRRRGWSSSPRRGFWIPSPASRWSSAPLGVTSRPANSRPSHENHRLGTFLIEAICRPTWLSLTGRGAMPGYKAEIASEHDVVATHRAASPRKQWTKQAKSPMRLRPSVVPWSPRRPRHSVGISRICICRLRMLQASMKASWA